VRWYTEVGKAGMKQLRRWESRYSRLRFTVSTFNSILMSVSTCWLETRRLDYSTASSHGYTSDAKTLRGHKASRIREKPQQNASSFLFGQFSRTLKSPPSCTQTAGAPIYANNNGNPFQVYALSSYTTHFQQSLSSL
jgi:hypothetical protein